MDIMTFIKPELLILVPVLYIMGMGIKGFDVAAVYDLLAVGGVSKRKGADLPPVQNRAGKIGATVCEDDKGHRKAS